jgi:hypothetical protein
LLKDIQEFKNLTNVSVKEAYEILLATTIDGVYGRKVIPLENPVLNKISEKTHRICERVAEMLKLGLYGLSICDALREVIDVGTLYSDRRHIIVCDALAIHDVLLLSYEFEGRIRPIFAVNPGGKTKTYEYMIKQCPIFRRTLIREVDEPSLTLIARIVAQIIGASSEKYDEFDRSIHSSPTKDFRGLVTLLYRPLEKLLTKVKIHLNAGYTVLMLADHGYDINLTNFALYHKWSPRAGPSLSILAPLLVIK